jgi:predicted ATPase
MVPAIRANPYEKEDPLKLTHIDIKNFLALEHVTLDLQAPINIIDGANEAG